MKLTLLAATAAIFFLASAASGAGPLARYMNEVGRNAGYGISDGYHAQRYCLPACTTCGTCSPVQQPMMPYPTIVPEYTQWAPPQYQQVRYPVGYYAVPVLQPQYPSYVPSYQPTPAPDARHDRNPATFW